MTRSICVCCVLLCLSPVTAAAQTTGKFAVGVTFTPVFPADDDMQTARSFGVVLRQIPKKGFGLTGALNWFTSDLEGGFLGVPGEIGQLRVRPLMGGVGYTFGERYSATVSIVGGPSFNRLRIRGDIGDIGVTDQSDFERKVGQVSLAVRPGVGGSVALTPRVAIIGFGGYLFNRPTFTIRTPAGNIEKRWTADSLILSAGVAVALF